jgi:hypothetical protein
MAPLTVDAVTITVRTTLQRYPSVVSVDYPVSVIPFDFVTSTPSGTHELMGTRSASGLPDGQSRYEIRFSVPQRRAAVQRDWNTNSLTRFYNSNGNLLGEHQNTVNREFVGYIATNGEDDSRVSRIEIDGLSAGGGYQVGFTDDLFFGSVPLDVGPVPLWIVSVARGDEGNVTLNWAPAVENAWIQFSADLINWQVIAGPVRGDHWTGATPSGGESVGYLRVATQAPSG